MGGPPPAAVPASAPRCCPTRHTSCSSAPPYGPAHPRAAMPSPFSMIASWPSAPRLPSWSRLPHSASLDGAARDRRAKVKCVLATIAASDVPLPVLDGQHCAAPQT
ncbi:unnamed protein product [Urochloa humidicola]